MYIDRGSPKDAREIAQLYSTAFPDSVELFFAKKPPHKLSDLLELTFLLLFYWGAEAVLVKDATGATCGYCLYLTNDRRASRRSWGKILTVAGRMIPKASPVEAGRLLHNQLLKILSMQSTRKVPTPKAQAKILSIAISPSYQGQGVGTSLFKGVLTILAQQSVGLNVRADNVPARQLYARAGFEEYSNFRDLSGKWIALIKSR